MNKTIIVKSGKAKPLWQGHPWLFRGAIASILGNPQDGDIVLVVDNHQQPIGYGIFNSHSLYQVRMILLTSDTHQPFSLPTLIEHRIRQAIRLRQLLNLPNENTNCYRLINSEGDILSGLSVDIYNQIISVTSSAYWVERYRDTIIQILQQHLKMEQVIWHQDKKNLQQDGWEMKQESVKLNTLIQCQENNLYYQIDFSSSQKSGFYLDQRDNRLRIREWVGDKTVLDLCCYTGGFSINAAFAQAKKVIGIDSSATAIHQAKTNLQLNHLEGKAEFISADINQYLQTCELFDVVVLDPPKLAPSVKHIHKAKKYYIKLNQLALMKVKKPGIFITCTCSSAIGKSEFMEILRESAAAASVSLTITGYHGAASDHVLLPAFPEGHYLQAAFCIISPAVPPRVLIAQ